MLLNSSSIKDLREQQTGKGEEKEGIEEAPGERWARQLIYLVKW